MWSPRSYPTRPGTHVGSISKTTSLEKMLCRSSTHRVRSGLFSERMQIAKPRRRTRGTCPGSNNTPNTNHKKLPFQLTCFILWARSRNEQVDIEIYASFCIHSGGDTEQLQYGNVSARNQWRCRSIVDSSKLPIAVPWIKLCG